MSYQTLLDSLNQTLQSKQARPDQVPNNAGGYGFAIDKWQQLSRFLTLGTTAGSYYVGPSDLTKLNLDAVKACIAEDGARVVKMARDMSVANRIIKNDTAILVLALAISLGDKATKRAVRGAIGDVCRTGTHILNFAGYCNKLRHWGRSLRGTIAEWYNDQCKTASDLPIEKGIDGLAYQMVKYQSRDGWSHKDLIRLSHVGSNNVLLAALYDWALHGAKPEKTYPTIVNAFEKAKTASPAEIADMVAHQSLSREMIPTDKLNQPLVAKALALTMPPGALLRNLGNLGKAGLLEPGSEICNRVIDVFHNKEALKKARLHPIAILIALKTYASGQGVRGSNSWPVTPQVVDALNDAFYLAFESVEPLKKRIHLSVDVSGSMGADVVGTPGFSAREAAVAMALVTANTEPYYSSTTFATQSFEWTISPRQRLDDVLRNIPGNGGTDVSVPIHYLKDNKRVVDAIVIYTDGETYSGVQHPYQAMEDYRRAFNPKAKLIIVAAVPNSTTVAVPDDPLSLTICGFDVMVPEVIRAFLAES